MATNALAADFRAYLEGCSEEMARQIISVLQQAARPTAPSAATGMTATGSAVAKTAKKQRKKAKSDTAAGGPKRPLNSWMAFRKFYNAMLAPHTQKTISKALTIFWREDPFEGKWAILAKAYSTVRGSREKSDAPLDEFFTHCAPLIGVIPPNEYMLRMGWQVGPPHGGDQALQITRLFTPSLDNFPAEFTTTTLSVDDLVNHCYAVGYVSASNSGSPNTSVQGSLTMVSRPTAITTSGLGEATHMFPLAQTNTTLAFATAKPNSNTEEELHQALLSNLADSPSSPTNNADPSPLMAAPAAGQATLEQATIALEQSGAEYPYSSLFDPASNFDVSFNPAAPNNEVEDDGRWDAYDPSMSMAQNEGDEMTASLNEMLNVNWEDFVNGDGMF